MMFLDDNHRKFYIDCVNKSNACDDTYRKALFYTLGLTGETRLGIGSLYDFKQRSIVFAGLFAGFQTGTSIKVTRLAFNLYNGFAGVTGDGRNDDPEDYSPYFLFDTGLMPYFFEAIKLRYPEYYRPLMSGEPQY